MGRVLSNISVTIHSHGLGKVNNAFLDQSYNNTVGPLLLSELLHNNVFFFAKAWKYRHSNTLN